MPTNFFKAVFSLASITYYVADIYYDWSGYYAFKHNKAFAVVPRNSSVASMFYLISCILGTVFGVAMMIVCGGCVAFYAGSTRVSLSSAEGLGSCFLTAEFAITVCELLFKDDIQSILLFYIYHSDPDVKCVSSLTKAFTLCSVLAHTKQLVCFVSTLFQDKAYGSKIRCMLGFLGCVGSIVFLVFTSWKFADMQTWIEIPGEGDSSGNCTQYVRG